MHLLSESNLRVKKERKYKSYNYLKLIINGFYLEGILFGIKHM